MDKCYLDVLLLLFFWICVTEVYGQGIINIYAERNTDVVLNCPYRDTLSSDTFDLLWFGPPYISEGLGTPYFSSADGLNSNTPVGDRLSVVGDQSAGEYNMKISNLQQSDTGIYSCVHHNNKTTFSLQLIESSGVYGNIGDNVTFSWILEPTPGSADIIGVINPDGRLMFQAFKTNNIVEAIYQGLIIFYGNTVTGNMTFVLKNITKLDAGFYKTAYNGGIRYAGQILYVTGKPTKPFITEIGQPLVNKDLQLNCSVTSTTVPTNHVLSMTYVWMIGNLSLSSDIPRYKLAGSMLIIRNINKMDINTTVTCTGTEQEGIPSDESNIYVINPNYGPDTVTITPSATSYPTKELITISDITCSADCKPNCHYRWTKDGQVTSHGSGSTLSLMNINRIDTGVYRCTAWNVYNTSHSEDININVFYLDLYTMVSTEVFQNTQDIHLVCDARGNPSDIVFQPWTQKVGSKVIRSLAGSITSNTTVLIVPYSSYQDHGIYTCYADNKYGTLPKSKDTTVTVNDKPVITDTVITQEQNGSGEITVDFYSVPKPLKVEWLQKGSIISLSEKYRQSNIVVEIELTLHDVKVKLDGYRAQLRISSITDSDYGTYVLRIENDKGIASQQIEFKPKDEYKLIIGLSVGIVIPVLIAAVAITMYIYRRQKQRNQTDKVGEITHYEDIDRKRDDANVYQGISLEGIEISQDSSTHVDVYEHVADRLELKECQQPHQLVNLPHSYMHTEIHL